MRIAAYDSFGRVIAETDASVDTRYLYTGREFDEETELYYYRARYYDVAVGRFIGEDPISFLGGDLNLYGYVLNNPIAFTDPFGLVDTAMCIADSKIAAARGALLGGIIGGVLGGAAIGILGTIIAPGVGTAAGATAGAEAGAEAGAAGGITLAVGLSAVGIGAGLGGVVGLNFAEGNALRDCLMSLQEEAEENNSDGAGVCSPVMKITLPPFEIN